MTAATMPSPAQMRRALARVCTGKVLANEPLAPRNSWRVGGCADVWVEPKARDEVLAVIELVREKGWPLLVLGSGSNVLVADAGVRGVVMNLTPALSSVHVDGARATVGAGVTLFRLAKQLAKAGLGGAEFCIGIPGTLGGALVGNAGAFGGEICDVVESVELYAWRSGKIATIPKSKMRFSYRHSSLAGKGIVLAATLVLREEEPATVEERLRTLTEERVEKQPVEKGTAGSTFKNPEGAFAGQLIEEAGLKGLRVGDAMVSLKHANFIVNLGEATAEDTRKLIRTVKRRVKRATGVSLEEEVRYVGAWS